MLSALLHHIISGLELMRVIKGLSIRGSDSYPRSCLICLKCRHEKAQHNDRVGERIGGDMGGKQSKERLSEKFIIQRQL